jgi:hypothetical protein
VPSMICFLQPGKQTMKRSCNKPVLQANDRSAACAQTAFTASANTPDKDVGLDCTRAVAASLSSTAAATQLDVHGNIALLCANINSHAIDASINSCGAGHTCDRWRLLATQVSCCQGIGPTQLPLQLHSAMRTKCTRAKVLTACF